ncbi:MAG: tetratricopeptide repeat protein, partial [Myxococcota bacterium]
MTRELDANALERALAEYADAPSTDPKRLDLEIQLAWAIALQDKERSRRISEVASTHARSIGDERLTLLARRNLTYVNLLRGQNLSALPEVRELVERFRQIDEVEGLLSALDILFYCWEAAGDYSRALEVSLETKELAEKAGRRREKAWAIVNIGVTHMETGDLPLAERALMDALAEFNAIQHPAGVARTKSMLGRVLHRMGRIHDALAVHIEVLALYRDTRLAIGEAQSLSDIAQILEELGRPDHALTRYRASAAMFADGGNRQAWGRVHVRMARLRLDQGDVAEARQLVEVAVETLRAIGVESDIAEAVEVLARVEEARGEV